MLEDLIGGKTKFVIEWNNIPRNILKRSIDLHKENVKSSLRATKQNLNKWGKIPLSRIEVFDIIDSVLKLIYKFFVVSLNITTGIF